MELINTRESIFLINLKIGKTLATFVVLITLKMFVSTGQTFKFPLTRKRVAPLDLHLKIREEASGKNLLLARLGQAPVTELFFELIQLELGDYVNKLDSFLLL